MEELDPIKLKEELDQFKKEKERIRKLMGQVGGKHTAKVDKIMNRIFIILIAIIAINDILHYFTQIHTPIPTMFSLEVGVLMVSIKIIWMMHKATKVEHFQFWILNSIEFRLNEVSKQLKQLENSNERCHSQEAIHSDS